MSTLFVLVTGKYCSDLILPHIDNQNLFLQHDVLFIFLFLVVRWIDQVILNLMYLLKLVPVLMITLYLYLKAYLFSTVHFRKKLDGFCVTSLLLDNNRQHMPVCAKMIL